jgi:N-methylhydantoinase A
VTDAHLVLGRLVETEFLGGTMTLDVARARRAVGAIARRIGRSVEIAAAGIVDVATAAMERALRVISVERGRDPAEFTLVAFGGAGGLHAATLADALGMTRVLIPRHPGLLSAWGMLVADVVRDVVGTLRVVEPTHAMLAAAFRPLVEQARRDMARDGVSRPMCTRDLDVRYVGQGYELTVPHVRDWRERFHALHRARFGHADVARPLEVVALRVRASGGRATLPVDTPRTLRRRGAAVERSVWFDGKRVRTAVHRREELPRGWRARGPLIVCEYSATTVVPRGWVARVERSGELVLERAR